MMHQTNSVEVFVAEKTTFDRLTTFLRTEFYRSPARVEYDRAYSRLKQKKNRRKIGVDEWNAGVAEAMRILEMAERGELNDDEMRARFREL